MSSQQPEQTTSELIARNQVGERMGHLFRQVDNIVDIWDHPELGPPQSSAAGAVLRVLRLWQGIKSVRDRYKEAGVSLTPPDVLQLLQESIKRLDHVQRVALREPGADPSAIDDQAERLAQAALDLLEFLERERRDQNPNATSDAVVEELRGGFTREIVFDQMRRAAAAVKVAETAAATAESAANNSRKAAGRTGSLNLAEHFEAYRKSERKAAEWFRGLAVLVVIVTVIVLVRLPHEDLSVADVLQRALIAVPTFGLAGYLAAEAGRHRRASQWAATLKVQLLTVDAYVEPLGGAEAAEVRQHLARRAFGELPTSSGGANGGAEEVAMSSGLQAVLDRILAELKAKPEK